MCGIWAFIHSGRKYNDDQVKKCIDTLSARGPESTSVNHIGNVLLGFCRLAINDLSTAGMQPMGDDTGLYWVCNGEIYNWKELKDRLGLTCMSSSDCSIIGPLWRHFGGNATQFFQALDGVFAMAIYDTNKEQLIIGRDPYGIRPLFSGIDEDGRLCYGSEMKSLIGLCKDIQPFPPGQYTIINTQLNMHLISSKYHTVPWLKVPIWSPNYPTGLESAREAIRESLRLAVRKRLMTERPIAALLSGGVDSSIICALLQSELKRAGVSIPLKTFSIGFEGSPDLYHAQIVATHIGSEHTEIKVTPDDFFNAIPDVIRAIESYDITTVRASIGNWMVAREIRKRTDCKVVFNGDGSDEIFGSYLYFFRAPDNESFESESARLLEDIHYYDVLRSDRSISSHGLEPRTPFLDKQFVATARAICTQWRRPINGQFSKELDPKSGHPTIEKWILRKSFEGTGLLPDEVLWRRKEAFSDGVSNAGANKAWYHEIEHRAGDSVRNWISQPCSRYAYLKPLTAESFYYRQIFNDIFGSDCNKVIKYFWMPKWSGETTDPSARTLSLYK